MTIYVTLDDNMGMMFNNRRQSQDKIVREHILKECTDGRLWMNEYTAKQFGKPLPENVIVDSGFLEKAADRDGCFVENTSLQPYINRIKRIVIYKWNRIYPADIYFDIRLDDWKIVRTEEFAGSSHELITREEWIYEN